MGLMSMTGFGVGQAELKSVQVQVEMKSVNHRFLDFAWRLPSPYQRFEVDLTRLLRALFRRGRFDVGVTRRAVGKAEYTVTFNEDLFRSYEAMYGRALGEQMGPQAMLQILRQGEVIQSRPVEADLAMEFKAVEAAVNEAASSLTKVRQTEGSALEQELLRLLGALEKIVRSIETHAKTALAAHRERLQERLRVLLPDAAVEPARVAQEIVLLAERSDITEELSRLHSHFHQFREVVKKNEGGKKLEFLLQEMVREVNTLGSKANGTAVSPLVVEAKADLERLREQVQNVE